MVKLEVKSFLVFMQVIFLSNAVPLTTVNVGKESSFSYMGSYKEQESKARFANKNDYFVSANPATWGNALADCKHVFGPSANMVTIETVGEWQFLKEHLENYSGTRYWTSGMYDPLSYVWRWTANSQPLPYFAPWASGFPNNPRSILRVMIYRTNQFDASWCTEVNTQMERFICEVPAPYNSDLTDPNLPDDNAAPCDYFKNGIWV